MPNLRNQLLALLLQHKESFLSGEKISEQLQVSRTAIWKHIEALRQEGYQIEARPRSGYRLIYQPDRLGPEEILPHLTTRRFGHAIRYERSLPSTQPYAHQWAREGAQEGALVIADEQTAGRGRLGRRWIAPAGAGIWMSLILRPPIPLAYASQLTLVASVGISQGISDYTGLSLGIKWPNDLLIANKKVCGILTELRGEQDRVDYVILGIGINVNLKREQLPEELQEKVTSLSMASGKDYSRRELLLAILVALENIYDLYLKEGFEPIRTLWEQEARIQGRKIVASTPQGTITGTAIGLDKNGSLLLQCDDRITPLYSAEIQYST